MGLFRRMFGDGASDVDIELQESKRGWFRFEVYRHPRAEFPRCVSFEAGRGHKYAPECEAVARQIFGRRIKSIVIVPPKPARRPAPTPSINKAS